MCGVWPGRPWVYPRVCGGSLFRAGLFLILLGLSPRVRGKPGATIDERGRIGSIPACAGEASMRPSWIELCAVYPRVCGGSYFAK